MRKFWIASVLVCAGLVAALVLLEISLRLVYSRLPSLAALEDSDYELLRRDAAGADRLAGPLESMLCRGDAVRRIAPGKQAKPAPGSFKLVVAGDSVVAGHGLEYEDGVAELLQKRLQKRIRRPTRLTKLGLPGGGICHVVSAGRRALERGADALVAVLFADDLENHQVLETRGEVVAFPGNIAGPRTRFLASHSYLANMVWLASLTRRQRPTAHTNSDESKLFVELVGDLVARARMKKTPLVLVLLAPTGLPHCPTPEPPGSRCTWMRKDMDLMASLLTAHGHVFVDLRTIWDGLPPRYPVREGSAFLRGGGMAIHPDGKGHQMVADAILPALIRALKPSMTW